MKYAEMFSRATQGGAAPYPYQERLAEGSVLPSLLKVPTGAGKTEAAALGWLYRRFMHPDESVRASTPRRLVYCLPMRTLVDQTVDRINLWLNNLEMHDEVGMVALMGGEPRTQWYLYPEKPFIIVGTQDMLLSRALNRGYGSSPFMWPVEYGLLNNDALWVMDEVQLMANGLSTSAQLAGIRNKLETCGPAGSLWMSATIRPQWLSTVDHPEVAQDRVMDLGPDDKACPALRKRYHARKTVSEASIPAGRQYAQGMAALIRERHEPGTLTLAILNTVERAQALYHELHHPRSNVPDVEKVLVHSRFRTRDRDWKREAVTSDMDPAGPGMIVVATQAIEAGMDISAKTLVTELAPWPSLVQRFGRCNRRGDDEQGAVLWVDVGARIQDAAPYTPEDMVPARQFMRYLEGESAGPADLEELGETLEDVEHLVVIRQRDVIGLFDTTPDLSGSYLDVSQYVRGADERSVSVYWREVPENGPEVGLKPLYSETVSIPLGKNIDSYFNDDKRRAWVWDFLDDRWRQVRPRDLHPSMTLLLSAALGGYSPDVGWDPSSRNPVEPVPVDAHDLVSRSSVEDGQNSDPWSVAMRTTVILSDHCRHVEQEVRTILNELADWSVEPSVRDALELAALYHDAGKAHPVFQRMMMDLSEDEEPSPDLPPLAKSSSNRKNERRHFRHEVGSALAILEHRSELDDRTRDLAAYLAAAHHGKVRLGMRSLPGRNGANPEADQLLGYRVSKAETLPAVDLGEGLRIGETNLDLSIARLGLDDSGRRSWLDRSASLLNWLGPFRLAFLEALVRAADMRASRDEQEDWK